MFRPCFTLSLVQVSSPPLVLYVKQSAPSCHSCLVQVSLGVSSICVYLVRGFDSVHCCHTSPCQVAHSFLCWFSGLSRPKTLVAFFVFRDYVCSPCFSHFPAFGSNQVKFACTQFGHSPPPTANNSPFKKQKWSELHLQRRRTCQQASADSRGPFRRRRWRTRFPGSWITDWKWRWPPPRCCTLATKKTMTSPCGGSATECGSHNWFTPHLISLQLKTSAASAKRPYCNSICLTHLKQLHGHIKTRTHNVASSSVEMFLGALLIQTYVQCHEKIFAPLLISVFFAYLIDFSSSNQF